MSARKFLQSYHKSPRALRFIVVTPVIVFVWVIGMICYVWGE
jgi:hypothetical protein